MPPTSTKTTEQTADTPLLTPDEFRAIATRIHRNTNTPAILLGIVTGILLMMFLFIITYARIGPPLNIIQVWVCILIVGSAATCQFNAYARRDIREVARLVRFISTTHDVRMLGSILDLKYIKEHPGNISDSLRPAVDAAVLRLLPHVQTCHAEMLTSTRRAYIRDYIFLGVLITEPRAPLNMVYLHHILRAMEQVGEIQDYKAMQKWPDLYGNTAENRVAIQRCLDSMLDRITGENPKNVLLRPERKPEAADTLLRPSEERSATPPEHLLRATEQMRAHSGAEREP